MRILIAITLSTSLGFGAASVAASAAGSPPTDSIRTAATVAPPAVHKDNLALSKGDAVPLKQNKVIHVGEPVRDEYLVFLEDGNRQEVPAVAAALAHAHSGRLIRVWNKGVQGFWISMAAAEAEAILHEPRVRAVEENAIVHSSGTQDVGGSTDPFWHLDRIDQRSPVLNGTFQYCNGATQVYAYIFDLGVRAADPQLTGRVLQGKNASPPDGVNASHTAITDPPPYPDGASFDERNPCGEHNPLDPGHGTSVATLLAGSSTTGPSVGVSKTTIVVPLRVANCQEIPNPDHSDTDLPSTGAWIDAFDWLFYSNALWDSTNQRSLYPGVANFSMFIDLGSRPATTPEFEVERRVRQLIRGGVVVVASANNQFADGRSLFQIPARLSYSNPNGPSIFAGPERVITVGGTMRIGGVDKRWICGTGDWTTGDSACRAANGSNFGIGIDIWAPAENIQSGHNASLSPVPGDDPWTGVQHRRPFTFGPADGSLGGSFRMYARSGTSFAAPIVAGAAARLLSEDPSLFSLPSATAATVWNRLSASATRLDPVAANLGAGSPNLFIYIGGVNFKTQPQSVTTTGSTAISAEAVGTGLTYQLYEGVSGNISSPVGAPQSGGTFTISPSSTKTYWIRATNTCPADNMVVTGDSAEAIVTVTLLSPTITARTQDTDSRNVHVNWSLVSGATSYRTDRARCTDASCWEQIAVSNSATITSYDDTPPLVPGQPVTTYLYRVVASNSSTTSTPSAIDFATTATTLFAEPIGRNNTLIRGSHVKELRNAIDAVRSASGLSTSGQGWTGWPASYTDATGYIYGADIGAMRRALDQAISTLKPGTHFSPVSDPTDLILSDNLNNLREAVR